MLAGCTCGFHGRGYEKSVSTFQLFQMFPDEETARTYLESRLWPKRSH